MKHKYPEVFSRLTYETATIIFFKKDGHVRIMLGTRNLNTVSLEYGFQGGALGGHDNRCNINNGNVALIDLVIGEPRSFSIERVIDIEYHGVVDNKEDLEKVYEKFSQFKESYESTQKMEFDMSMLK